MNNYGTAISKNDEVIVSQKKKKKYPKTMLFQQSPSVVSLFSLLLLLIVPSTFLIIFLFNSHKNNDVVIVTKLLSNNSNTNSIITINYDAARTGPICVSMDNNNNNNNNNDSSSSRLQFVWKENHNLYQLPNEISFRNCDFSNATLLQKAGPNPTGYTVKMNNTTTIKSTSSMTTTTNKVYYFACSKLCASNGHKVQVCVGNNGLENDNTKCSATVATNTNNECTAARTYDLRRQQP